MLALDMVDAGIGDTVIALQEGTSARQILGRDDVPVHTLVIAVVDGIEIKEDGNEG
jgi:microcompartment protein CcmK/EutM